MRYLFPLFLALAACQNEHYTTFVTEEAIIICEKIVIVIDTPEKDKKKHSQSVLKDPEATFDNAYECETLEGNKL